jgi:hypothetical protein
MIGRGFIRAPSTLEKGTFEKPTIKEKKIVTINSTRRLEITSAHLEDLSERY